MKPRNTRAKRRASKAALLAPLALMLAGAFASAPLMAQRDPAYAAARASGQIGEKMDGYLGIVGEATEELKRLVRDINIKRRAIYAERAQEAKVTIEEYAFTAGCQAILRTVPGEKYQAPDGSWQIRTSAPPLRDPRCP